MSLISNHILILVVFRSETAKKQLVNQKLQNLAENIFQNFVCWNSNTLNENQKTISKS